MQLKLLAITAIVAMMAIAALGCDTDDIRQSRQIQATVSAGAFNAVPPYQPQAFAARENINWYLKETEDRHTWYVYAFSGGSDKPLFYVVSDMKPMNICISITAPDRVINGTLRSAPALDGVYYGGAGCDAYYMRDAITGGFIELAGRQFSTVSSKVPLFVETDVRRLIPGDSIPDVEE